MINDRKNVNKISSSNKKILVKLVFLWFFCEFYFFSTLPIDSANQWCYTYFSTQGKIVLKNCYIIKKNLYNIKEVVKWLVKDKKNYLN